MCAAVHCGAPAHRGWWALLYVATGRANDHTQIRASSDSQLILDHVHVARKHWKHGPTGAGGGGGGDGWVLALMIGAFDDEQSARLFCEAWAERCRGAISRVARGEALSRALGLRIYGDFRIIFSDPHAYDYIEVVGAK
jgi:hypothetical protein